MNRLSELILKGLKRKFFPLFFNQPNLPEFEYIDDREQASRIITEALLGNKPCMIARYGSTELSAIVNYLGVQNKGHSVLKYLKGECSEWWSRGIMEQMTRCAGFFPATEDNLNRYCRLSIDDSREIDVLGSWIKNEYYVKEYSQSCKKIRLRYFEPDFAAVDSSSQWTQALKGKKVLVIHPFIETIKKQYVRRKLLFKSPELLPDFELLTIKAVQSIGGHMKLGLMH